MICGINTLIDKTLGNESAIINDVFTAHVSHYGVLIGYTDRRGERHDVAPEVFAFAAAFLAEVALSAFCTRYLREIRTLYGHFHNHPAMGNSKRSLRFEVSFLSFLR